MMSANSMGLRTLEIDGQRLRVAIRPGDEERWPLLLVNGLGANLEPLQPFVDSLDGGIETIRVDLPGTGESPAPIIPYRPSGLSRLLARLLDELAYPEVDVLGISLGGIIAQQFARQYGKSQNLIRRMRDEYDEVLRRYDLLLMPTTPQKPARLPPPDASPEEAYAVALKMNRNTAPFCATGHPSITVPCGTSEGLPVGLMLIGRHHEEALLYRTAYAVESSGASSR